MSDILIVYKLYTSYNYACILCLFRCKLTRINIVVAFELKLILHCFEF